ncbi:MAG: hypothetical protein KDA36_12760, partial [Planctomycetaceae bacterium]|nr:hypothetical protein [Planctomycetaceae bacterium]
GAPKHHEIVKQMIDRLQREKQNLEVITLDAVDAFTAESSIRRMLNGTGNAGPTVTLDSDYDKQQLYIRATPSQMEEIRDLLTKMGEKFVDSTVLSPKDRGKTRTIQFEGDLDGAIKQIQGVWPRIRKNEIRVVTPSKGIDLKTPAKTLPRKSPEPEEMPAEEPIEEDEPESLDDALEAAVNEDAVNEAAANEDTANEAPPVTEPEPLLKDDDEPKEQPSDNNPFEEPETTKPPETPPSTESPSLKEEPAEKTDPEQEPQPAPDAAAPQAEAPPADSNAASEAPPILIVPGENEITITSDDIDALDQLENLLRNLSRPERTRGGRDFTIFMLKNTGAKQVADNLEDLFGVGQNRRGRSRFNPSGPTIVADERINAILVHGSRTDRDAIEELLKVMDSPELLEFNSDRKTERIVLKNARATRIEDILRDLYKAQLTS